ncbi:hypothetical protein GCM10022200_30680 [Microbacterium awajiense]|uniref:DNA primase n=1 Tax=Microbacterium awajiense TaxID=415214 RepID=A0ABP7B0Y4_9MICO
MTSTSEPVDAAPESAGAAVEVDPALLEAHDLALAALKEITPDETIGVAAGYRAEAEGVVSLRFENRLGGYPGWYWTVSVARVEDAEPTVLEAELLPGDGALLAPDWVPWAERLAEYQAAQAAAAEAAAAEQTEGDSDDGADEFDDVNDLDASDFDADGSPILHAGDVDGVDIDELDEDADDSDEDDSDEDESDEDESDEDDSDEDEDADDSDEDDSDED